MLSLIGDVTLSDADPQIHAHVVIGKADATTFARGWDVEISRRKLAVSPFVSYEWRWCSSYFS